eukprot:scaffold94744_cov68-Phaeocystis_antarctica.AAC.6
MRNGGGPLPFSCCNSYGRQPSPSAECARHVDCQPSPSTRRDNCRLTALLSDRGLWPRGLWARRSTRQLNAALYLSAAGASSSRISVNVLCATGCLPSSLAARR